MASLFPFETITPSADWQRRSLLEFHLAPNSEARDAALAQIASAFTAYVGVIARSWWRRFGRIGGGDGLQDIESAGRHALLTAIRRWHPSFEKPFIHFAAKWISESCKTEVARLQEGAVSVPLRVRMISREYRSLRCSSGDEFLQRLGLRESTKTAVRFLAQSGSRQYVSTDAGETEEDPPFQLPTDDAPIQAAAELSDQIETIRFVLLTRCDPRRRLIFYCIFPELVLALSEIGEVEDKAGRLVDARQVRLWTEQPNLSKIGDLLGVSRERVRQLQNETILKIRKVLAGEKPQRACSVSGQAKRCLLVNPRPRREAALPARI